MYTTGIVAEFNPFHNGHKYLIESVKQRGDRVVCVIGDDFTQRGDTAIVSKYARAEAALCNGADLCLLLPAPWSMSCAYNFAIGGMSVLKSLGVIDCVAFGSECGDTQKIISVSEAVHGEHLSPFLHDELKKGTTFAAARQSALRALIGDDADILAFANDTLATEYVWAAKEIGFKPEFKAIKRKGEHDSDLPYDSFLSASAIRKLIKSGELDKARDFMPPDSFQILKSELDKGKTSDISTLETAILSHLRRLSLKEISELPEISEGIENRIFDAIRSSAGLEECYAAVKSKRYTLARIRRIILSAYLGIDKTFFGKSVPYVKVLGFNKTGEEIIRNAQPSVPLIMRSNDYLKLTDEAADCFRLQNTAADLYALSLKNKAACGNEYTTKLITKK